MCLMSSALQWDVKVDLNKGKMYAFLWVSFRYAGTHVITIVSSVDID